MARSPTIEHRFRRVGGAANSVAMGLAGSTVLITGGTGSFGSTFTRKLLAGDVTEVRIMSRDEAKQDAMRRSLSDSRLRFYWETSAIRSALPTLLRV